MSGIERSNRLRRFVLAAPYLWMGVFSLVPLAIIVGISFSEAVDEAPPYAPLIDFASGLTYALDGGMSRIADKVFLLTPRNVEVSAEERARMLERGFFNQA